MGGVSRRYVRKRTPDSWELVALEAPPDEIPGEWTTHPRAVWVFGPRPRLKVAVRPETANGGWDGSNRYLVAVDNGLQTRTHRATSTGFLSNVDIAQRVMWGLKPHGISAPELEIQVGLSGRAAVAVANRIHEWTDLTAVHDKETGFKHIDGVGGVNSDRLERAISGAFLNQERRTVARNPDEQSGGKVAVYAVLPCLDGWRVRKEWRQTTADDEKLGAWVMLPTRQASGGRYGDVEAAVAAAETFAARKARTAEDAASRRPADALLTDHDTDGQAELKQWD